MRPASAQVVIPGVEGEYSYLVPRELSGLVELGARVLVPFRSRRVTGFVIAAHERPAAEATRSIERLLDDSPAFSSEMLEFTRWIADYYLCTWGDALRTALPAGLDAEDQFRFSLTDKYHDQLALGSEAYPVEIAQLLDALEESPLTARQVQSRFGIDPDGAEIKALKQTGQIEYTPFLRGPRTGELVEIILELTETARRALSDETLFTHVTTRSAQRLVRELRDAPPEGLPRRHVMRGASKQRRQALQDLLGQDIIRERKEVLSRWRPDSLPVLAAESDAPLTGAQALALAAIAAALDEGKYTGFLLHGVTGSGKTRVYIEAIQRTLDHGRTALVLVPEIALTPVLWGRFRAVFGDLVAIQHSAQPMAVRYDLWRGIARGEYRIVIGARSAVFAPLPKLGLVVVDEEHEASYKQTEGVPRYSARDAALYRAVQSGAVAILGSATPSLESLFAVENKRLGLLTLPERVSGATLPQIELTPPDEPVEEIESGSVGQPQADDQPKPEAVAPAELHTLSKRVYSAIEETLERGKQVVVLQNRRGFAPFLICRHCGKLFECPNCSVSLTYHRPGRILRCHYCHHRDDAPDLCPSCGSADINLCGSGTQRIADELADRFPDARIARMDSDAMARAGAHGELMSSFASRKLDILVGTQMIAKGLDFPNVELAVVADADTELFYPDFRASERGASLLVQISGRAGRASATGRVIMQTRAAEHPALTVAVRGDWLRFASDEMVHRRSGGFPPYSRLVLVRGIATDEGVLARAMLYCKKQLATQPQIELLGPSPCAVAKIRNRIRYQLLARTARTTDPTGVTLRGAVKRLFADQRNSEELKRVQWEIDVDPAATA